MRGRYLALGALLLVPVAYVKFDALEHLALNKRFRDMLAKFKTPRRMEPSIESRHG